MVLRRGHRQPEDLAAADPIDVEQLVRSTGFFRNTTRSIMGMAAALVERYHSQVPARLSDRVTLPGVGATIAHP